MKYRVYYLAAPVADPAEFCVPFVIDTRTMNDARSFAIAVARSHPHFRDWCKRVEIHDDSGMVACWDKHPVVVEV